MKKKFTEKIESIKSQEVYEYGFKSMVLGSIKKSLGSTGVLVPASFIINRLAIEYFIKHNALKGSVEKILDCVKVDNQVGLENLFKTIQGLFERSIFPQDLKDQILTQYISLKGNSTDQFSVAVRLSSSLKEDMSGLDLGVANSPLNVTNENDLLERVKKRFAECYFYSLLEDELETTMPSLSLTVLVQIMVGSDVGESGVAYSVLQKEGCKDAIMVKSSYGLGGLIEEGIVTPDEFVIHKASVKKGVVSVVSRRIGGKEKVLMKGGKNKSITILRDTPSTMRERYSIDRNRAVEIASQLVLIENFIQKKWGKELIIKMDWAIDGPSGKLFIVDIKVEKNGKEMLELKSQFFLRLTGHPSGLSSISAS